MKKLLCLCSLLAVLVLPVIAEACVIQYSVTVTAGSDVAVFQGTGVTDDLGYFECVLVDKLVDPAVLLGNDDAAIESLVLKINSDPEVGVEFGLRAGGSATTFSILSDVVTFSALVNPTASASAGVTLTDRNSNGAAITGLFGGKVHQARYNSSTVFADLVSDFSVGSGGTQTNSEAKPLSGSETITGTLTSIESEFNFILSARDSASGTSTFVVIPEPATIAILNLGGLLLRRKK